MLLRMRYLVAVTLFSVIVLLIGLLLFSTILKDHFLPVFYLLVLYFLVLSLLGRLILLKSGDKHAGKFNTRYFLVRWSKVMLHMIIIVIYIVHDSENALAFVLTFLACYVLYSVFDIYTLNAELKKK